MKLNNRSFNRTRLAVALTLAIGSMTMMATPASAQVLDENKTYEADTVITAGVKAPLPDVTNFGLASRNQDVVIDIATGKTLTVKSAENHSAQYVYGVLSQQNLTFNNGTLNIDVTGKTGSVNKVTGMYAEGGDYRSSGLPYTGVITRNGNTNVNVVANGEMNFVSGIAAYLGGSHTFDQSDLTSVTVTTKTVKDVAGIHAAENRGGDFYFKSAVTRVTVTRDGNGEATALSLHQADATFDGKAIFTVTGKNTTTSDPVYGINMRGDTGDPTLTTAMFNDEAIVTVSNNKNAIGLRPSGESVTATFNKQANFIATSTDAYAVGVQSQYAANANFEQGVTVDAEGAYAIGLDIINYNHGKHVDRPGKISVKGNAYLDVNATKHDAYGIYNQSDRIGAGVQESDGNLTVLEGNLTVIANADGGKAYGVYANGELGAVTVNGQANLTSTSQTGSAYGVTAEANKFIVLAGQGNVITAKVVTPGQNSESVGFLVKDSGKLDVQGSSLVTGDTVGVKLADAGSALGVGTGATLDTNSMDSLGTTTLADQSTLSLNRQKTGESSNLGHVTSSGGTVDLGSGDYTVTKLDTTAGATTTLQLNDFNAKVAVKEKTGEAGSLTLKGTSVANGDQYENADAAAKALVDAVTKNSQNVDFVGEKVVLEQGSVNDGQSFTIGENGEQLNKTETKNTTLTAYNGLATLSAFQWRHDMNDLTKRMGELRLSPDGVGAWARVYGSKQTYGTQGLTAKNHSLQVGVDTTVTPEWTVGTAFTYTDGKSTYDLGSADNKAYGFAAYGTWMAENGQFVDLIAKYSRLSNDFTVNKDAMAGSFDNNAFSVSAEYGWHWNLNDVGFLEPQAELTYGKVLGETFTANNGVKVVQEDFESLIARLGVRGGFYFPNQKGVVYARASVLHDFKGEMESTASKNVARNTVKDDIGGTWVEWGVGANFKLSDTAYTYVDVERTNGGEVVEDWRYNAGVRLVF